MQVDEKRGVTIPDRSYRDVLYMLIDYFIRSFKVLEHNLSLEEREEIFDVFKRLRKSVQLQGLPETLEEWTQQREEHLAQDLVNSQHSADLFKQCKKNPGLLRYIILWELQAYLVPEKVHTPLHFRKFSRIPPILCLYKFLKLIKLDEMKKALLLPDQYKK
jgi:hypothetical protein